jgi:hypothetical protein
MMSPSHSNVAEAAGGLAGLALAPVTGLVSALRSSRMFHPTGLLCSAEVEAQPAQPECAALARELAGPALVRFSSAWWKTGEWVDVLGCAIRFTRTPLGVEPHLNDQDLLLATIQRPWTMPLSPFSTYRHDFLGNAYYGVSPFEVAALGRIEWRLRAGGTQRRAARDTRAERLEHAIRAGSASLWLECAPYAGALRRAPSSSFRPVVRIELTALSDIDQRRLRFDPFRTGRGIEPTGFVHSMRRAAYHAGQALRPRGTGVVQGAS